MNISLRILDLDGSLTRQEMLISRYAPRIVTLSGWGPRVRMGCAFGSFRSFERALTKAIGSENDPASLLTLYGSGDFHHVTLALLGRQPAPCNLVVIDNHPDWMRGIPFLHCGTWVYHAARLSQVRRILHIGGDVDFDNGYRFLAPWPELRQGRITVIPARRAFERWPWAKASRPPLRTASGANVTQERFEELLQPIANDLQSCPLYISLDKDVLTSADAPVNWDSGHLGLPEVRMILRALLGAARGQLAGMDIVGDWSPVQTRGALRRLLHLTEHPALSIDSSRATHRNELTNLTLVDALRSYLMVNQAAPAA
jgi:arginase family enzyme